MKTAIVKTTKVAVLTAISLFAASTHAVSQDKPHKSATWNSDSDTIIISPWDNNIVLDLRTMPNGDSLERVIKKSLHNFYFNSDSISQEINRAMAGMWVNLDSLNDQITLPEMQFFSDDSDFVMEEDTVSGPHKQEIEVEQFDSSNPKEMQEMLKKLEVEGKLPQKGEYSGLKVYRITRGDSSEQKVYLQPKGKVQWIDAATGKPVKDGHYGYFFNPKGKKHVMVLSRDGMTKSGKQGDCKTEKIIVNSKGGRQIKIIITDKDSTNAIGPKSKSYVVMVNSNSDKNKVKKIVMKKMESTIVVSEPSNKELAMLEKGGFKKEKGDKKIPDDSLSIGLESSESTNNLTLAFTTATSGKLTVKIAGEEGKVLVNDTQSISGSFKKSYKLDKPTGDYFLQLVFDGKRITRKISIK